MSEEEKLNESLKRFWELEAIGVPTLNEDLVHEKFVQEITFKDGRYEVSLPWRENSQDLPVNYDI